MKFIILILSLYSFNSKAANIELKASYEVPTQQEDLKEFSKFDVSPYTILDEGSNKHSMLFALPADLVGTPISIQLQKVFEDGKHRKFSGEFGNADCNGAWTALVCEFKFENLNVDSNQVLNHLYQKYGYSPEMIKRLQVSLSFQSDPIGIVKTTAY